MGQGPMTGRGAGPCERGQGRGAFRGRGGGAGGVRGGGFGRGRGFGAGRGRGRGFGAWAPDPLDEDERDYTESGQLRAQIERLEERLARLEKKD
jgi:hypothetical protein